MMPAPNEIRNVAVFCASADGVNPIYRAEAAALGRALADRKIGIVYGLSLIHI